jgi:hypothetical protein
MFTENKQALNLAVTGERLQAGQRGRRSAGTQKGELFAYCHEYKRGDKPG